MRPQCRGRLLPLAFAVHVVGDDSVAGYGAEDGDSNGQGDDKYDSDGDGDSYGDGGAKCGGDVLGLSLAIMM